MLKSEDHFLEIVNSIFPKVHEHMQVGRGDDCAVLKCPERMCVTSDLFLEDVHFRLSYFSPEDVGHKALAVNLSDLAAHGADPLGFNLNLIWPGYLDEVFCRRMLKGMAGLAEQFDLALTGGDLSFGNCLGMAITIWGRGPQKDLLRGRCLPGDVLFVVGELGLSRCGLLVLEENQGQAHKYPLSLRSHLRPYPLVQEGRILAKQGVIKGLMDVSDGLARDLPRFLAPGTGADIDLTVALNPEVAAFCRAMDLDPVVFSLLGGEDYALLGGCRADDWTRVQEDLSWAWQLGKVVQGEGIYLQGQKVLLKGFDHFEKQ
ncbi:MAG: thiamine-phosphate kinase [Desulfonatronovibrio sp.]